MRLRSLAFLATMALVGVMASSAFAQPGGAGGRGGRGGAGGFGGGMGGRTQSTLSLAGNEAVQKELGLTDDQIAKVKTLNDSAREELRGGNDGFAGLRDLPEDERRAKMTEMMAKQAEASKKVAEKYKPKLAEVLDAKQVTRLDQIALQAAGAQAYADPEVAKTLKLTKDQQDKLASITKEAGEKTRELFGQGGGGGAGGGGGNMEKVREINAARDKDLAAVLTADQATQFASMKGKEFDVAALRRGPGGPGGGGQGGQGRGNGGRQRPAN